MTEYFLTRSRALLWTHLDTKVSICILEHALSDTQLNCRNKIIMANATLQLLLGSVKTCLLGCVSSVKSIFQALDDTR